MNEVASITKKSSAAPAPPIKKEPPSAPFQQQPQPDGGPKIKTEPGLEPQGITAPPMGNAHFNPQLAVMRAQQNIQQKFGGAAVPILSHQQQQQQQQQQKTNGAPKPPGGGLMLPGFGAPPAQQQHGHNGIPQVDGSDEYDMGGIPVGGYGYLTREQADNMILQKIEAGEKQSADLQEALKSLSIKKSRKGKGRQQDAYDATASDTSSYPYPSITLAQAASLRIPQLDGSGSSDVEVDDDAINSDLDDPEDNDADPDDDEDSPQIMLCMYDKVQRTKNKWKCVMKDGVLTINGKE